MSAGPAVSRRAELIAPFDAEERGVLAAAQRWNVACCARCQYADDVLGMFPDVDHPCGWPRLLRELVERPPTAEPSGAC